MLLLGNWVIWATWILSLVEFILNLLDAMWQIINMFRSIKGWNGVEKQNVETTQLYDNSLTGIEHFL